MFQNKILEYLNNPALESVDKRRLNPDTAKKAVKEWSDNCINGTMFGDNKMVDLPGLFANINIDDFVIPNTGEALPWQIKTPEQCKKDIENLIQETWQPLNVSQRGFDFVVMLPAKDID